MSLIDSSILIGPQHKSPNKIYLSTLQNNYVIGTTPGNKRTIKTKYDGNEDCLLAGSFQEGILFSVCDAHFGARSAEICIQNLAKLCNDLGTNPVRTMFQAHYELDTQIKDGCIQNNSHSATTCITGFHQNHRLSWVNSGDSSLFIIRNDKILTLNKRTPALFLGEFLPPIENTSEEFQFPSAFFKDKHLVQYFHLILSTICSLANAGTLNTDNVQKLLSTMQSETGVQFQGNVNSLTQPWNNINTQSYRTIPEWGQFNTLRGDIILSVTDGIYETDESTDVMLELIVKSGQDVRTATESILQHTLDTGGRDNASLFIAVLS